MESGEPTVKRLKLAPSSCIICFKRLKDKEEIIVNPTREGLLSIIKASEIRKDEVYNNLWNSQEDILSLKLKVSFHKSCRASYTHKKSLLRFQTGGSTGIIATATCSSESGSTKDRLSRHETYNFDIRKQCFICGTASKKGEKLTQIATGSGCSTRDKVLSAAERRQDNLVHLRMLAHPDLFAFDAKYHRTCYSHYISERNIAASQSKAAKEASVYDKAFQALTKEIDGTLFSKQKPVTTLTKLRVSYIHILSEQGIRDADQYKSWKLKARLTNHYGEKLVFAQLHGESDIVCSSELPIGAVLRKSTTLQEVNEDSEDEEPHQKTSNIHNLGEMQILHTAAGILRKHMVNIQENTTMYDPPSKADAESCASFVPNAVYDFVNWCITKKDFSDGRSCSDTGAQKDNLKVIALCHTVISHCQKVRTPLTLGLGLQIHHDFGSKQLIDTLYSLGYCVSYDEIRRFLTSAASDIMAQSADIYIPRGLENTTVTDGFPIVDAAIDNFDQNEATLDGKSTTHAMAAVLFQRENVQPEEYCIPRLPQKSLPASDAIEATFDTLQR